MSEIIKVEHLSKAYQLGQFSTGTLSADIHRWWAIKRGKEDPYLKLGETNDRSVKGTSDIVWSLRDINFSIEEGNAVGIIGKNGAGKSTLLKILSQVTSPTTGSVKLKGRVASLLEVGTGFHPELTGKENIYLNGAILGMRKHEIKRKFDEIVDFSGVERYIDTPVKRYSSGMYVRLAFAVAAHLESEILIVDEVLAVGDAEFQKKCMGKMGDVSKDQGRTILFVSHNMQMISALCQKCIILKNGEVADQGLTHDMINSYLNPANTADLTVGDFRMREGKSIFIEAINLNSSHNSVYYYQPIQIEFTIRSLVEVKTENLRFSLGLNDQRDQPVVASSTEESFSIEPKGVVKVRLTVDKNKHLMPGNYKVGISMIEGHQYSSYEVKDTLYGFPLEVLPAGNQDGGYPHAVRWKQGWGSVSIDNRLEVIQ